MSGEGPVYLLSVFHSHPGDLAAGVLSMPHAWEKHSTVGVCFPSLGCAPPGVGCIAMRVLARHVNEKIGFSCLGIVV